MQKPAAEPRLTVVSPFVDKRHGTERCLAEQIERLAGEFEIHLYSERVEDIDLSKIIWHRVWLPGGPHLFRFVWWFFANRIHRSWDRVFRGFVPAAVYSPGINCLDADVMSVHVLFCNLRRQLKSDQSLASNSLGQWPVTVHRRVYYRLIESLERKVYGGGAAVLLPVSRRIADDIATAYGRSSNVQTIYYGVDTAVFSVERRKSLRKSARAALNLSDDVFAVLLIGNGWKNKGLSCLLEAARQVQRAKLHLLIAGSDDQAAYRAVIKDLGLAGKVTFLPPRRDVEFFYAATDAYAGPSLEDSFSLPCIEAMSCGLPVITSAAAGVSEIMHQGEDGLILQDPRDARTLAEWIQRLAVDVEWRHQLGQNAVRTAAAYSWNQNAEKLATVLHAVIASRKAS